MDEEHAAAADVRRGGARPLLLVVAVVVWLWTTFSHAFGRDLAGRLFAWANEAGNLADQGGLAGVNRVELILAAVFGALVLAAAAPVVWRLRRVPRSELAERLLPWVLWGAFLHLVWKCLIVYATELVHFAQYGLIALLLCAALGGARRPLLAFLIATGLGALDEAWQHWGLAFRVEGNLRHGLDWSDLILNATGACGGALVFATVAPRAPGSRSADRLLTGTVAVLALALLPLLLLDPATLAGLFGWYHYHPYWHELEHGKPVHWMTPFDGIPLVVASVLFLGTLLRRGRTFVSRGVALSLVLLFTLSVHPPTRRAPRPVHEVVPHAEALRVPRGAITVDGVPDEPVWADAQRLGPFVHHVSGAPALPLADGGSVPLDPSYARIVWDEDALYVAFEVEDDDVWGRAVPRDEPTLPGDEVVEVFVDPDGDEITYYEIEVGPQNAQYDLFNVIPGPPMDHNPWAPFLGLADWDAVGLESAVAVQGTLDTVESWESAGPLDEDRGWTVEIRIPWSVFRTTTTPSPRSFVKLPPEPGQRWRMGLYRVERPRVSPLDGTPLDRRGGGDFQQLQAWSHTLLDSFHVPARFGVVEFVERD